MSTTLTGSYRRLRCGAFPLWVKIPWTLYVGALIPVYWRYYGPANFLWFSDIALFASVIALWFEWRLLASMAALAVLLPELAWNVGFFSQLVGGPDVLGLAGYMYDPSIPALVRGFSLFHIALPPLLLWLLCRLGYDRRALPAQALLAAAVLPLSYAAASADNNINWTRGVGAYVPQPWLPDAAWVLLLAVAFAALLYLPTHLLLARWFGHTAVRSCASGDR